jgi:LPS sulfotransferase NodH
MKWRERLTAIFGPGLFAGVTCGDWLRTLRAHGCRIAPKHWLNAWSITYGSVSNSLAARLERWRFADRVATTEVPPPVIILGHWRSGTTLLHNLLCQGGRFAFPNLFQVMYPHTFLTAEAVQSRLWAYFLPRTRCGLDNVALAWDAPYEDEFATATLTGLSPYLTPPFPEGRARYDRYLTFRDASREEAGAWQQALLGFLRKVTWKYGRPLVLKSPGHTCRIRLLLEMFPEAKFVHIHRHPCEVFRSSMRMMEVMQSMWALQRHDGVDWEARVIRQYREMYDVFFEERGLIPPGQFHEVRFADLEANPVATVRGIYEGLSLPEFAEVEPALRGYVASLAGYRKNEFPPLAEEVVQRLAREWGRCFEEWGYEVGEASPAKSLM